VRPPATDFIGLLGRLLEARVEFIIIGGLAGNLHGSARATFDIDIVYDRSEDNLDRIVGALAPLDPYPRGAPAGLPFVFDRATLQHGLNFTLETSLGDLDLLGEVAGGGTYQTLKDSTFEVDVFGFHCRVVTLSKLIALKRAAGRPRDLDTIAELEAIVEERECQGGSGED
jgi:hypothetical protein